MIREIRTPSINPRSTLMRFRYLDPKGNEVHQNLVRAIEELYPVDVAPEAAKRFDETFRNLMKFSRGTTLRRAMEALDEDQYAQFMRLIFHLKVVDGYMRPTFREWEPLIDRVDFDDFEKRESFRFTDPGDFTERFSFHDPVPLENVQELQMPEWSGSLYESAWALNVMTTKLGDLESRLNAVMTAGVRWNRTIARFIFKTLLESNPTIMVDGTAQSLFSASHSNGQSNDYSGGSITALDRDALKGAIQMFSDFTVDEEEIEISPKYVVVHTDSDNAWNAKEILGSKTRWDGGSTANNSPVGSLNPELVADRGLEILETRVIDKDSWFVLADFDTSPELGIEFGYFEGQEAPSVIDIDRFQSPHYHMKGENRWLARGGFGGTPRNWRGAVRGSTAS